VSHATEIMPHLPYLRRYARALCGSQRLGDSLVAATLEAILAVPNEFPGELPPRLSLYRLFQKIWSSSIAGMEPRDPIAAVDKGLPAFIVPESRQVLLLVAMEGFTHTDAAVILETTEGEIRQHLQSAAEELNRQNKVRVLVLEDEPLSAMELQDIVTRMGHKVVAHATTRAAAVEAFERQLPDLVLADIQLADNSSGSDAVKDIFERSRVPVVFITAYPERLLTGDRPEPTFLVTKPFRQETVQAAISQALFFQTAEPVAA